MQANEERFCDASDLDKVRRQISIAVRGREKLAFLLLSGSFNPVHTQHVRALSSTRKYIERLGWTVVGGFLAPSTDTYMKEKFAEAGLSLTRRIALCKLA